MADTQQQIAELSAKIAGLEASLTSYCGELAELNEIMTPFLSRYQKLIRPYYDELVNTQREIADIKVARGDRTAGQSGEARSPLDRFFADPDVQEQYERAWHSKQSTRPTGRLNLNVASPEVKDLYRQVIVRMHPELTQDKTERARRKQLMVKVDEAFVKRDPFSLEAMAEMYRPLSRQLGQAPQDVIEHLRDRVVLLETAVSKVEGQKYDLRYGLAAKMKAYAEKLWAEEKRDLLTELSEELRHSLANAQAELMQLRQNG